MNKTSIRKDMIMRRRTMEPYEREVANKAIYHKVISLIVSCNPKVVFLYASMEEEVDTHAIINYCIQQGIRVALPKVVAKGQHEFYTINHREDLVVGAYGLMEPKGDEELSAFPSEEDIIFVPGVVFDESCNRIGFGGGYYDRYLSGSEGYFIALAYNYQIIQHIDVEETDIPMDRIITDKRIIEGGNRI